MAISREIRTGRKFSTLITCSITVSRKYWLPTKTGQFEVKPFVVSKVSPLSGQGVTNKQSLFEAIFRFFISLQLIDFKCTKKLFLERYQLFYKPQ